jgi:predicted O-methyltransferase YrrM
MGMKVREDLPSYLNELELTWAGVEVGVLRGDFAWHILKQWKGQKLYCVDAWRHISGNIDINNPDHNGQLDNMAKTFMNLYEFGERAVLIKELSVPAARMFEDYSLDFVYLDAAHDYENVKADLEAWENKIRNGGLLCGHDYIDSPKSQNGHSEFGVKRAVDEFAKVRGLTVQFTQEEDYPTWFIQMKVV